MSYSEGKRRFFLPKSCPIWAGNRSCITAGGHRVVWLGGLYSTCMPPVVPDACLAQSEWHWPPAFRSPELCCILAHLWLVSDVRISLHNFIILTYPVLRTRIRWLQEVLYCTDLCSLSGDMCVFFFFKFALVSCWLVFLHGSAELYIRHAVLKCSGGEYAILFESYVRIKALHPLEA